MSLICRGSSSIFCHLAAQQHHFLVSRLGRPPSSRLTSQIFHFCLRPIPPHSLEVTVELGRQEMTSLEASYTSQPLKASHSSHTIDAKTPTSTVHHQILSSPELGQCWREIFSPPRYFSLNDCCFRVVIERSLGLSEWAMLCR